MKTPNAFAIITTSNLPTMTLSSNRKQHQRRTGIALLETLIAAGAVLTMLSVAAPLLIRSARVWKQTQHYQFATDELSGQMDRLIAMSAEERSKALNELSISSAVRQVLHDATLVGKLVKDDDGSRIVLAIDWVRMGEPTPIQLVAWIDPGPDADDLALDLKTTPESSDAEKLDIQ